MWQGTFQRWWITSSVRSYGMYPQHAFSLVGKVQKNSKSSKNLSRKMQKKFRTAGSYHDNQPSAKGVGFKVQVSNEACTVRIQSLFIEVFGVYWSVRIRFKQCWKLDVHSTFFPMFFFCVIIVIWTETQVLLFRNQESGKHEIHFF